MSLALKLKDEKKNWHVFGCLHPLSAIGHHSRLGHGNENHRFWSPRASPQGYRIQFSLFGQIGKIFHYFDQFLQKDILIFFKITLSCLGSNWSALHELFKYAIHLLFTQFLLLLWPFVYLKWRIPKIAENLDFWKFSKHVKNCPKNNELWIMKISLMFF